MKNLFIIILSALALSAAAQNDVKRVAILETVDKLGTVPYLKQLMFRSNLTSAISNTAGYEGYDRTDLKEILGEQNFQRTGMVSDKDIKKIGEFTGAQYVLVAEAVVDGEDMFITAKIIDVETARVVKNSNQLMGTSASDMQSGSQKVAADLLGGKISSATTMSTNSTYKQSSPSTNTQASTYNPSAPSYSNHSLSVDKTYFSVSCDYNVVYLTVTCDTTWEVQHPTASMYSVDQKGNTLKITIKENPFQYDRSNYFNVAISDGSVVKKISLIQKGNPNGSGSQAYSEDPNAIFSVVEDMPEFPGGQRALFKYLSEHIKYPVIAQENGIQGRVICQFTIDKDGSIVDVEVVRSGGDPSLDREAVRVIKSMPKWKPGQQRGLLVRSRYTIPCNFSLK